MPELNAYLTFEGTCAEAMRFYQDVLGGKLDLMTFGSTPAAAEMPAAAADLIMHACLVFEGGTLMASDNPPGRPPEKLGGFSLALNYPSAEGTRPVFDRLAEGGQVVMPLEKTFWAEAFGMLVDRFGTPWMINAGGSGE